MLRKSVQVFAVLCVFSLFAAAAHAQVAASGSTATKKSTTSAANAGTKTKKSALVDINAASKDELAALAGIGDAYSQKIIDGRPYTTKRDILTRKIVPQATYDQVKDKIIAHRAAGATGKKGKKGASPAATPK
jgi:competence protein ComEA